MYERLQDDHDSHTREREREKSLCQFACHATGHVFPCHIGSTYALADSKIFKVGIYEIDDDWKPFLTHNYDNDME